MKKGYTLISGACERGYTLIEVLVSLTIVGLLFAVGFASFRDFSRRQAVASQVRQLRSDLRFTQELALSGKKPVTCTGLLEGYNFNVVSNTSYKVEALCSTAGPDDIAIEVKSATLSPEMTLTTPSLNPVTFKVLGEGSNIPSGQSVTYQVILTATGYAQDVTVSATGEIK